MFFLPKNFKYEVNANSEAIADKIQEKIKPVGVRGVDGDVYDFNGVVDSDSFELTLNPTYVLSTQKGLATELIFCGSMQENNGKTTVAINTKYSKSSISTLIFFVVFWVGIIGAIEFFTQKSNFMDFLIYTGFVFVALSVVMGFFVNLTTRDVRERLESIFKEFGYERIK